MKFKCIIVPFCTLNNIIASCCTQEACELADISQKLAGEIQWALRFKKSKVGGKVLSPSDIARMNQSAYDYAGILAETSKVLKIRSGAGSSRKEV